MSDRPAKDEKTCDEKCDTCPSAQRCSRSTVLSRKAKIDVKHVILVLIGRGGAGRSTIPVNLAFALANHGKNVGLPDLDFHSPDLPKMPGIEDKRVVAFANAKEPVHVTENLAVMSISFLFGQLNIHRDIPCDDIPHR